MNLVRLELYRRPETGTPLKKKEKGERHVGIMRNQSERR